MKQADDGVVIRLTGASSGLAKYWDSIDWRKVQGEVTRLQMRIAKAVKENDSNKVKVLQRMLTRSFSAKLLAVKRVTSRKGSRTPGVDGIVWNTSAKKMRGAINLQQRGYKAQPLRRVLINKKNGKKRPLGIPTIKDRAMQALYLLALEPVSETMADVNSYGFRVFRGCRDAISQCFNNLSRENSATWVLDADIKACFDWISHDWLLENIAIEKSILIQWLKCGYVQDKKLFPTRAGTPQGGIISPTLANMTLDGLEKAIKEVAKRGDKINFVRYADDFIVTAKTKEILKEKVIPVIERFLAPRGLQLSEEKTRIVHIEDGFNFLGQNMRKFGNKFITQPAKDNTNSFKGKVKETLFKFRGRKVEEMVKMLNSQTRGWCNYHRFAQSGKTFSQLDSIYKWALEKWCHRRHGNKTKKWIRNHYWGKSKDGRHFACTIKNRNGKTATLELVRPTDILLARHTKIRGAANPFDVAFKEYFRERKRRSNMTIIATNRIYTAGVML